MISINKTKTECCGCSACEQICPQNCIKMDRDSEGFLYPTTNFKQCIECNKCIQICPIKNIRKVPSNNTAKGSPLAYGGWHKDDSVRYDSSSGGAFTLFAEKIIAQGGIVYGCTLNQNMKAVHIGVENETELYRLRGSKYVQSDIGNIYSKVKKEISTGRKVLFVGTPCQAAGLYFYLRKKTYENLYIMDFICHGVPSPKVFEEYIHQLEHNKGSKIVSFRFRNKDYGWKQFGQLGTEVKFANNMTVRKYPAFRDSFMNGFSNDVYLRPSCYDCQFKVLPKEYSDFTIADFWGVNSVSKNLYDGKGTSLILVHNEHGMNLWNQVKDKCYFEQVKLERAIYGNASLLQSAKENPKRTQFFMDFEKKGFSYVEKKYMSAFTWGGHKIFKILSHIFHH